MEKVRSFIAKFLDYLNSDKTIFAVDLYEVGLADKVERYFNELLVGVGAVRTSLHKYVN